MSTQEDKKDGKGRIENLFSQFGKRLDDLAERARNAQVREEVEERLEELKRTASELEDDFSKWKDKNQDRWKETEDTLERTANIVKDGVKDIVDRIRKETKHKPTPEDAKEAEEEK